MEEQENPVRNSEKPPRNFARPIGLVLGLAGLVVLAGTALLAVNRFGLPAGIDLAFMQPSREGFVIELDAAGIDAELARLRALPGETLPANLEKIAQARADCVAGLMVDKPGKKAMAAATRLFVVLFAIHKRTESPLIDPRFLDFPAIDANDTESLRALVESGVLGQSEIERLALLVEDYVAPSHPIYSGLGLKDGDWAYLDFLNIVAVSGPNAKRISDCYRARLGG